MNALLAAISGQALIQLVVWVVVIGLIFSLLLWLIAYCELREPFAKVARVILAVAAVLILINLLLGLVGSPIVSW